MNGFRAFLLKTNALALAIGVIIATALGTVVTSLVNDVIMPPIGLALRGVDFTQLKFLLRAATGGDPATEVAIRWGGQALRLAGGRGSLGAPPGGITGGPAPGWNKAVGG